MLITYERFGILTLPIYNPQEPIGAFPSTGVYADLPTGGAWRGYGSEQARAGVRVIRRRGILMAGSLADLDTQLAALTAKRGRVDRLYGRRPDGALVWTLAELSGVDALRDPFALTRSEPCFVLDVETSFTLHDPPWNGHRHGAGWTFDSGVDFDTGYVFDTDDTSTLDHLAPTDVALPNAGSATVRDLILSIRSNGELINGFELVSAGQGPVVPDWQAHIIYSGVVGKDQTLVLDMGAQSATVSTALTSPAVATATELTVANSSGFTNDNPIEVTLANGRIHRTTIQATADVTHITLHDGLPSAADLGALVRMSAWPDIAFGERHRLGSEWLIVDPDGGSALSIEIDSIEDATLIAEYSDGWE